ncbi:MAG: hypothetical protein ACLS8R_07685 [Anaeromassilibacillus sp.]
MNAEWHLEPLPFPIKVDHLLSNEVTLTRDPETGEYKGSFQLNGLAELLFQGKAAVEGEVTARWDEEQARLELVNSDVTASVTLSQDLSYLFLGLTGADAANSPDGAYREDGSCIWCRRSPAPARRTPTWGKNWSRKSSREKSN